jgi:hypothetical protein
MINFGKKHVLVLGSGSTVKTYLAKIMDFIKLNNVITIGCNNINHILTPDYHFWGSIKRWEEFGHLINKKSVFVFSEHFPQKIIKKKWSGPYRTFRHVRRLWKLGSENIHSENFKRCRVYDKNGKMFGCFKDVATLAIFWSFIKGATKISVVGNDGYTLYNKDQLNTDNKSQHCYGQGFTDGYNYQYCRSKDWDKYRTLRLLYKHCKKKYGFGFEIITPTIYDKFYNSNVLNIKPDPNLNKWREPEKEEYRFLYLKGKLKK